MLNIPYSQHLQFTEYVCKKAHEFYTSVGSGEKLICPFCEEEAWANGDFCVYVKPAKHNCTIDEK